MYEEKKESRNLNYKKQDWYKKLSPKKQLYVDRIYKEKKESRDSNRKDILRKSIVDVYGLGDGDKSGDEYL
jgi:hypothetical protein